MSGHSKWAQIKRQKGVADIKKGQVFTKLAKIITIAVRDGGGIADPETNFKLRLAIDRARTSNMPRENIDRAIERGKGIGDKAGFEEVLYEGFGPGGITIIVEAVSDNKLRTTSEIKNIIEKNGGTLGSPGSVAYQFEQKGLITVKKNGKNFDDIFMIAAECQAEDVEDVDSEVLVYTRPQDLRIIKDKISNKGLVVSEAELIRKPLNTITIDDRQTASKIISFMDKIEEQDDVQKIYSNFDIPDSILTEIKTA